MKEIPILLNGEANVQNLVGHMSEEDGYIGINLNLPTHIFPLEKVLHADFTFTPMFYNGKTVAFALQMFKPLCKI